MIKIYADFNAQDKDGRVLLNTMSALADLSQYEDKLYEGMRVLLYEDEFEVEGVLAFENVWRALPDFNTIKYLK
jgi:hypothetical protein